MSRTPLHNRLISIVEPAVEAAGYELVDLRFLLEQGGWTLRVAIDLPLPPKVENTDFEQVISNRVDLAACEAMSRELSAVLDVEDPIPQAFSLEVSSPGIDRPLRTAAHFDYFTGCVAKLQTHHPIHVDQPSPSERKNFKGTLKGVTGSGGSGGSGDGTVVIDCDGTTFELPIDDIDHAKLVPDWDAVMKGKSGFGTPRPQKQRQG